MVVSNGRIEEVKAKAKKKGLAVYFAEGYHKPRQYEVSSNRPHKNVFRGTIKQCNEFIESYSVIT